MNIAFFISSHGFGHAARACAVMTALHARLPALHFGIFTQVPRWFFEDSLAAPFTHHPALTDVGLVQTSPLAEDLPQTVRRLNAFLPFDDARVAELAAHLRGCALGLCDIAPLGIAVARAAGIPSVLIENFTWDWIYEGYAADAPGLQPHIDYLRGVFASADYHLQTVPVCADLLPAHLLTRPVSRSPRTSAAHVRERLGIPPHTNAVLLTMGGIEPGQYRFLEQLTEQRDTYFVIPGGSQNAIERRGNVILLPHHSEFFHPDLLNACDAVVGKLGYSTLAEAYQAGIPFGHVSRPRFRESSVLAEFVQAEMRGLEISAAQFEDGGWLASLPDLLAMPRLERRGPNGAAQVADFIGRLLEL